MADNYLLSVVIDEGEHPIDLEKIMVTDLNGSVQEFDPQVNPILIIEEHPDVNRLEGDLGAICEVFRQMADYYVTLKGVRFAEGDTISLVYQGLPAKVVLKVIEVEDGKTRVTPPAYQNKIE